MQLISFLDGTRPGFGVRKGDRVLDLGRVTGFASLRALLEAGALDAARLLAVGLEGDLDADALTLLPPIPDPGKVICVGLNYHDHVEETGRTLTDYPTLFIRFASTLAAHEAPLIQPLVSEKFDYEGELALVIGRGGRHIAAADALGHIAGYAPFNDGSVRDWQGHTSQFTPGKNFDFTGGFGPALVTPDEVGEITERVLRTRFNGQVVQEAKIAQMITPIPQLIAYISTFLTLAPGDVIVTGTPGGVGMKRNPPLYMTPGDVVEVDIEGVGVLRNPVTAEG